MASAVWMPCPISARGPATITELWRAFLTQPLRPASSALTSNSVRLPSRSCSRANQKPTLSRPPPTMPPMIALRRVSFTTRPSRRAQYLRRAMHGAADRAVGAAAADVGEDLVDVAVARPRVGREQRRRGHDEAGLAVTALGHLLLDPRLLHRVQPALPQPFDGHHVLAGDVARRHRARAHRHAVDMHRAGAALRHAAAEFRSDDVEVLAQDPEQRLLRLDIDLASLAVDGERDHRSMNVSPRTRTSILVRRKQSIASSGLQTTGSFSLKLVLSTSGTPVMSQND